MSELDKRLSLIELALRDNYQTAGAFNHNLMRSDIVFLLKALRQAKIEENEECAKVAEKHREHKKQETMANGKCIADQIRDRISDWDWISSECLTGPERDTNIEGLRRRKVDLEEKIGKEHNLIDTATAIPFLVKNGFIPETALVNEWIFVASALNILTGEE